MLWATLPLRLASGVLLCHSVQAAECTRTRYECALTYVEQQKFQAAIQSLTAELQQHPQNLNALNLLGIALTGSGQPQKAAAKFTQALAVNPRFYPARKNLAINEFDMKRFAEAELQFNRVLKDAPGDEITHVYLGEISFEKKDFAAAMKQYEKGRKRIALKATWILHYSECLLAQHEIAEAVSVLRLLPADDGENRFQAGLILGRAEAYAPAAELFASSRKRYSDPYAAGYNQLLMLIKGKSYPDAIQLFHELTAQGYQRAELYNLISEAYLKTDRVQDAYDALRTATRLEPESEDNYVDLASVCLEYEDYPLGKEILDVGIHYIPNSYRLYIQRGVTFVMRGSLAEAEKDFETAANLAPNKSLPYFALGWVWVQSAQTDKAVKSASREEQTAGHGFPGSVHFRRRPGPFRRRCRHAGGG